MTTKQQYQKLLSDVEYSSDVGVHAVGKLLGLLLERMDNLETTVNNFDGKLDTLINQSVRSPNY